MDDIFENLSKSLKSNYDVIVIGGIPWHFFPKNIRASILQKVREGAGLIYIEPNFKKSKNSAFSPLYSISGVIRGIPKPVKESFLTTGIPFTMFPASKCNKYKLNGEVLAKVGDYPYLASGKYGKGTVVALAYEALAGFRKTGPGLTPEISPICRKEKVTGDYWELYYSMLSKCIVYASRKLPPVTIESINSNAAGGKVTLDMKLISKNQVDVQISVKARNRFSQILNDTVKTKKLVPGVNNIKLTMTSEKFAGKQLLSFIIKNKAGKVLNWGSSAFNNEPACMIDSISLDKENYLHGEKAEVKISVSGAKQDNAKVTCELYDSYNRCLDRKISPAQKADFSFNLNDQLLSRKYTIKAYLQYGGKTVDSSNKSFVVTPSQKQLVWDDFEPGIWLTSHDGIGIREFMWPQLAARLHKLKMKIVIANIIYSDIYFAIEHNFHPTSLKHIGLTRCRAPKKYTETGNKMFLVRKPCLSSPQFISNVEKRFAALGKSRAKYGLRFYWLGDEQSITGYSGAPIDFCFSEDCLGKFREQMKKTYGSLDKLNHQWDTSFKSWDKVLPMTKEEAWSRKNHNSAPWADHLEFMDGRLEDIGKTAKEACLAYDKTARFSMSGTQRPTAYGGMDWWRQMSFLDGTMNYDGGGQRDLQRSFKPDGYFMPWKVGYGNVGGKLRYSIWEALFMGDKGIMGFHLPSMVNPDFTFSTPAKDAVADLTKLCNGLGKHYINNLKADTEVAILYSQASIRAAFIANRRKQHNELRIKYIELCRNLGINFNFISYEQLRNGILKSQQYKVLILPDTAALSKLEVDNILNFSKDGRCVIAEGVPGGFDEHCTPVNNKKLLQIFTNKTNKLKSNIKTAYIGATLYPDSKSNYTIMKQEQESFIKSLKASGVLPMVNILDVKNKKVRDAKIYPRVDHAGNKYIGIITKNNKARRVKVHLPYKSYVYELNTGNYIGFKKSVDLFISNMNPICLALLKKQPGKMRIEASMDGRNIKFKASVPGLAASVICCEVVNPNGVTKECYKQNIILKNNLATGIIPLAINDPKGSWKLKFKDTVTGQVLVRNINFQ